MTDILVSSEDVIVEVQQPTVPPSAPPPKIGLVEIDQVVQRGTAWLTGQGPPTAPGGQYGDMYLDADTGDMYQWDGNAWQYIGTFAPSTDTPAEVLAKLITVDGAGSALDADLLDGQHGAYYATAAALTTEKTRNDTQDGLIATNTTNISNNSTAITTINIDQTTQNNRMTAIEAKNTTQDGQIALLAPIASPVFTGDARAVTPTAGDNDTSIATTAFVTAAVAASNTGGPWAPIANPTFTGDPKAPTPATADNDTSIATTAFVKAQAYLTDAPNDGLTYGRKNNAWATIVGGSIVSDTAPTGTLQNGQTWWESDTGNLYIYYNDGDSSQWVMIAAGNPAMPPVAGDLDMKNYNILNAKDVALGGAVIPAAAHGNGLFIGNGGLYFSGTTEAWNEYYDTSGSPVWKTMQAGWGGQLAFDVAGCSLTLNHSSASLAAGATVTSTAWSTWTSDGKFSNYGTIWSNNGRILSVDGASGAQPSVGCYSGNRSSNYGFWNSTGSQLCFGTLDGNGVPSSTFGFFTASNSNLNVGGAVSAGSTYFTSGSSGVVVNGTTGSNPYNQTLIQGNPNWNVINMQTLHYPSVWAGMRIWCSGPSFDFRGDNTAQKPGGGSWADNSDARIKTVLGSLEGGLDAVLSLNPVRYQFLGNDTYAPPSNTRDGVDDPEPENVPQVPYPNSSHYHAASEGLEFIGLIAQEVQAAGLGALVKERNGYIDGELVTDLRELDPGPLVFVLINAIKELTARVQTLEAR